MAYECDEVCFGVPVDDGAVPLAVEFGMPSYDSGMPFVVMGVWDSVMLPSWFVFFALVPVPTM